MLAVPFSPRGSRPGFATRSARPRPRRRRAGPAIRERRHTLIAAPTGSGKTLAAFLTALDDLLSRGARDASCQTKCASSTSRRSRRLSADIHKNLAEPRRGIRAGRRSPRARTRRGSPSPCAPATRPQAERRRCSRTPPHILVTTPESLYLLLTSSAAATCCAPCRTVIVDEIHAVIGTRRGAHLALTLERLRARRRAPAPAARPVGHAEADRRRRALPRRRCTAHRRSATARSSTKAIAARWISASRCRARRSTP